MTAVRERRRAPRRGAYALEAMLAVAAVMAAAGVAAPIAVRLNDRDNHRRCLDNLRRIGEGIAEWSRRHDYALPPGKGMSGFCNSAAGAPLPGNLYAVEPGLNALWDKGNGVIGDVGVFRCPADVNLAPPPRPGEDFTSPDQLSYAMTGHLYPTDAPNKVIVADKSDKSPAGGPYRCSANHNRHFINVLFFGGGVRTLASPVLPVGVGSETGSIYVRETGDADDTYME